MKKALLISFFFIINLVFFGFNTSAQNVKPDTVKIGIYVTSIHDIDFKQKEYTVFFWLWLKYKKREFDFYNNLQVPQAKSVDRSFFTVDSSGEEVNMKMKLECVMKDSWKIGNFPFDRQRLRLAIENSQFDSRYLVFVPDTLGKHYDPKFTLNGWTIDSFDISTNKKSYETAFGNDKLDSPHLEFSSFRVRVGIKRDASGLFWKMFLGMYIGFLIAFVCFFIHADGIDSRFALNVGAVFAVIGNKYIIDSSLPESTSFTLVDTLHALTLFFIFIGITASVFSLKLVKEDKFKKAVRFDKITAWILFAIYFAINLYFISKASNG